MWLSRSPEEWGAIPVAQVGRGVLGDGAAVVGVGDLPDAHRADDHHAVRHPRPGELARSAFTSPGAIGRPGPTITYSPVQASISAWVSRVKLCTNS
jgi:hypothetical protein